MEWRQTSGGRGSSARKGKNDRNADQGWIHHHGFGFHWAAAVALMERSALRADREDCHAGPGFHFAQSPVNCYSLPQFENIRTFLTLGKKIESRQPCHNFHARTSNKQPEKIIIRSEGWLCSAECLECAPRDELKKRSSLT
jgi:hypothetical protein